MNGQGVSLDDALSLALPLAAASSAFINPKAAGTLTQGLGTTITLQRQREALEQQKLEAEALAKARERGIGLEERRTVVTEQEAARRAAREGAHEEAFRFISTMPLSKRLSVEEPSVLPPDLAMGTPGGPSIPQALLAPPLSAAVDVPPTFADVQANIAASGLSPQARAAASEIAFAHPQRFPAQQAEPEQIQRTRQAIAMRSLLQSRGIEPQAALAAAQLVQAGSSVQIGRAHV